MNRSASEQRSGSRSSREENRQDARRNAPQSASADPIHAINGFARKLKAIDAMTRVGESVLGGKAIDRVGLASGSTQSIPFRARLSRESSNRESHWLEDTTGDRFARMLQQSSS